MMNALDPLGSDWTETAERALLAFVALAAVSAAAPGTLGDFSPVTTEPGHHWTAPEHFLGASAFDQEDAGAALRRAGEEARLALRVLKEFEFDLLPEFDAYKTDVARAAGRVPARGATSAATAWLAQALRAARERFVEEAPTLDVWRRIALATQQGQPGHRTLTIPARFVQVRAAEPPIDIPWDPTDLRVDALLRRGFDDADSEPANT